MSLLRARQHPVQLGDAGKDGVRIQFGALIWRRRKDKIQILLVKSRRSKRWIIPKGWPVHGQTPVGAASREAWEEAGVKGRASSICIGLYSYMKLPRDSDIPFPCVVAVFPLEAREVADSYPEALERKRKWMSPKKAAEKLVSPELSQIVRRFDPKRLGL
ncbi:NUDIX hydrolase [Celeribacter litoreus]|uniref:NUDIX hydrolase n=1 Tax=Celeribacter litoreus TaxID=2876714 RepID=UPI001CCBE4BB|nr:NUDIX hydrolase [Celeribacter litoreus]MCA0044088.1 NUDIX hydrolase [Celeribacter litoreus]